MGNAANLFGVCVFALGIALLIFGFNNTTGSAVQWSAADPGGQPVWLLVGRAVSVLAGLVLAYRSKS
jgi:hypothetical protein